MVMFGRHRNKLQFQASAEAGFVDLHWRATEASGVRFRLLRSERGDDATADVLWEGSDVIYQDRKAVGRRRYVYLLQARLPGGDWQEQARARVQAKLPEPRDRSAIEAGKLATGAYDKVSNR